MRRARHSRVSGREQSLDELFSTCGLEAEPVVKGPDPRFPLRPFAAAVPREELVAPAVESPESQTERLYRRAQEAAAQGKRSEAVTRYREILAVDSSHLPARNNLSVLLDAGGDHEEALDHLTVALNLAPDDGGLLITRGAIFGRLKRYPEAEIDLRRAVRLQPSNPAGHYNLGLVLWRKGVVGEATSMLRRALELEPSNAGAWYYLGEALNQASDFSGARAALVKATELDPGDARAYQLLGRILDRLKQPEEARAMYQRARDARRP
jgi:superkiller protein 3